MYFCYFILISPWKKSSDPSFEQTRIPFTSEYVLCIEIGPVVLDWIKVLKKLIVNVFSLFSFLAHLSWKLKWAFLITCRPSSVCKLFTFSSSSREPCTGPVSTKLGTKHPWVKGIQVCSNEGPRPFPRGDNYEIVKIHWRN